MSRGPLGSGGAVDVGGGPILPSIVLAAGHLSWQLLLVTFEERLYGGLLTVAMRRW